jgi:tetratricopeptide (TPR) repeat protein
MLDRENKLQDGSAGYFKLIFYKREKIIEKVFPDFFLGNVNVDLICFIKTKEKMGIIIDVNEKLSDKIVENFISIIKSRRADEDRSVRKICDQCIQYLTLREVNYLVADKSIDHINKVLIDDNAFYLLLLGLLYESTDEDELAVKYFKEVAKTSLAQDFREDLNDFIILGKFYTLTDLTELENAGLILINKISNEADITDWLWQLSTYTDPAEHISTFEKFCAKAWELYPDSFEIGNFQGFLYNLGSNFEAALESFQQVRGKLEMDTENEEYNTKLANIWYNIATCFLKMGDPENTIESCDKALSYDEKSESFLIRTVILNKKAEALLLKGQKELALSIVTGILEENPEDSESLDILNRIKSTLA